LSLTDAATKTLLGCRAELDELNVRLLDLLEARGRVVETIAALKRQHGIEIYDPRRETAMLDHVLGRANGPFSPDQLERVFRRIFEVSRELGFAETAQHPYRYGEDEPVSKITESRKKIS
jgi:3-deoxy-7-phosphoheptulonate synthase / chorismate mutase